MSARDFLRLLRKRWATVLLVCLAAVAVAAGLSVTATKSYTATASVFFSLPSGTSGTDLSQGSNFTQGQMLSYAEIATKPIVLDQVIEDLGLDTTARRLAGDVTASASPDTVVIDLSATSRSPQVAADIANSAARNLISTARDLSPRTGGGGPSVDAAVVATAQPPAYASSPNTRRNLLAGLLGGLLAGVLAAYVREMLDTSIRDSAALGAVSGLPVLASIPFDRNGERTPLVSTADTGERRAEAYRQLRTNLQFTHVDRPAQLLVVTSAASGEGKSMTAANLALIFAEAGQRVLLVEADLRRPRVSDYVAADRSVGLSNVLAGQVAVSDVIQPLAGLASVLPSGAMPPNPSELLASHSMVELLAELRGSFDRVILDTPPVLPVTDATVVSTQVDGVILVARHGKSRRGPVGHAVASLRSVDAPLLGAVLNAVPVRDAPGYGDYGYYREPTRRSSRRHAMATGASDRGRGG
jgi:capsular exopolysaccharide synthesis family protein